MKRMPVKHGTSRAGMRCGRYTEHLLVSHLSPILSQLTPHCRSRLTAGYKRGQLCAALLQRGEDHPWVLMNSAHRVYMSRRDGSSKIGANVVLRAPNNCRVRRRTKSRLTVGQPLANETVKSLSGACHSHGIAARQSLISHL